MAVPRKVSGAVEDREGAGCIVFDTYMESSIPANEAVVKVSGLPTVSDRRWLANGSGEYGVGFDYDKSGGGVLTMRAVADKCRNDVPGVTTIGMRKMSGDRVTYGQDRDWSF